MRHRRQGRALGRSSSHRTALFRNMASALFLTEREIDDLDPNPPKVKGRIITTLPKAKEARRLVERCITIAKKSLKHKEAAEKISLNIDRNSDQWKTRQKDPKWQEWAKAQAPYVTARRRVFALLRDKKATQILFETIAARFVDRPGGYTRILKLATPRLGDAGARAILELVGPPERDRAAKKAEKPAFNS